MGKRVFNNCVINGVAVGIGDFIHGPGVILSTGYDKEVTTQNHSIHNVRISVNYEARFSVQGNRLDLVTQSRSGDMDNFGGTHAFKLDSTTVVSFKGLVDGAYDSNERTTALTIKGEANG